MSSVSRLSPVEELADFLARSPSRQEMLTFHLSDAALKRAGELMDENKARTLTADESRELDRLVLLDDVLGLIRSRVTSSNTDRARNENGHLGR